MITVSKCARWSRQLVLIGLALLLLGAAEDPRPRLVELQLDGDFESALDTVDRQLEVDAIASAEMGFDYLRGHLFDRLERPDAAIAAFTEALTSTPALTAHVRYRLALDRLQNDEPAMAAGLLVVMLANEPPPELVDEALALLIRSLARTADGCRLLENSNAWDLDRRQRRALAAALIPCNPSADSPLGTKEWLTGILQSRRTDETARRAAHRLADTDSAALDPTTRLLVGLTLYEHREFDRALPFLEAATVDLPSSIRQIQGIDTDDVWYAIARSFYWQGEYRMAAERFEIAAQHSTHADTRARALFQQGRSLALAGNRDRVVDTYLEAAAAKPDSVWAASALISAMRLEWRRGREDEALALFARLRVTSRWRSTQTRAALFLASSDLVQGRGDRAAAWLDLAQRAARRDTPEIDFWRGRLAEIEDDSARAVDDYASLLAEWPHHPLARAARSRLQRPSLATVAEQRGRSYSGSTRTRDLQRALQLLPPGDPDFRKALTSLRERWLRSTTGRSFLEIGSPPIEQLPLWSKEPRDPDEQLLALGIAEAYSGALRRTFPVSDTGLALLGSRLLSVSGLHRRSLFYAEVVAERIPAELPDFLLDSSFRRLLYPSPFDFTIRQQASRFGVDADLLRAIIREESRFDPLAVSSASARGLTQFVLPTARRLGTKLGWNDLDAWDLHDTEKAITLGAAYLAELLVQFDDQALPAIAAYNAGEDLARLWQSYCFSREPEEFFTKVGFRQTREYLEKVETSRSQYREIYREPPLDQPAADSRVSRTGGNES